MSPFPQKYRALATLPLIALGIFVFWLMSRDNLDSDSQTEPAAEDMVETPLVQQWEIGNSVESRPISVHTFGNGDTEILFVGGVHGGYEWNGVLLAEEMIAYLESNPEIISEGLTVSIIPSLNPDGVFEVLGMTTDFTATQALTIAPDPVADGRFNANGIDLNRNFDCKWAPTSSWRGAEVSAGTAPFSEPETVALRDYVLANNPSAVIFWHSKANTVYASECENGILPETITLMNTYATAANYNTVKKFGAYPITGDAEGWLASIGIPAVTVELEGRNTSEWARNLAGFLATLELYR